MVKRKRSSEPEIDDVISKYSTELFRALKECKGFERQRLAKRLRDDKATPEKVARLEREVIVLKSLDLRQAAYAHLCSSLVKIKALAESPKLPDDVKKGIPRPNISEEEHAALHNVTSSLYNRPQVRDVLDAAINDACHALGVPVPDKRRKGKKDKKESGEVPAGGESEEHKSSEGPKSAEGPANDKRQLKDTVVSQVREGDVWSGDEDEAEETEADGEGEAEEEEFQGFSDVGEGEASDASDGHEGADEDISDEDAEERAVSLLEAQLGGSSDSDTSGDDETGDDDDDDDVVVDEEDGDEISQSDYDSEAEASPRGVSPPKAKKAKMTSLTTNSTFLPSLMGGYISGSDSEASDIDVAPSTKKNRRGQRARQAIWEKKFGEKAKHLKQDERDVGWDPRRGAVETDGKPWKKGIRNPLERPGARQQDERRPAEARPRPPPKRDDTGPLHPSWEAKKKAKEMQATASFQGKKVTFD